MNLETYKIKEIHKGVFWMLLEFPTSKQLRFILSDAYRYVWCHNHLVCSPTHSLEEFRMPLFQDKVLYDVLMMCASFDFIVPTEKFREILPKFGAGIHVVQLNKLPPYYLNLDTVKGKERYRLLGECDWLFEYEVPGNDFGEIVSPKREFLEELLRNPSIEWEGLPQS